MKIRHFLKRSAAVLLGISMLGGLSAGSAAADTGGAVIDLSAPGRAAADGTVSAGITPLSVNTVKTSIFGANVSWIDEGYGLWSTKDNAPYSVMTEKVKNSGVQHLRYPGGIEGDYLHWNEIIGPLAERKPQIDCFSTEFPTFDGYDGVLYPVEFGVDEFFSVCEAADVGATVQLNAGTGTPEEAAGYIDYLIEKGYIDRVDSICVGNEVCMDNDKIEGVSVNKNPVDYSEFCKKVFELAGSGVVDSDDIVLGVIGITPSHPLCAYKTWDAVVLDSLADQIDFIDVHIGYSYYYQDEDTSDEDCVRCFMASSKWINSLIEEEESLIDRYAGDRADDIGIQMTECGPVGGKYPNSLAGSIFTADLYNTILRHPRVTAADYLPLLNHFASAQIIGACTFTGATATETYWDNCASHVFRWYTDQIGRDVLRTQLAGFGTFDAAAVGLIPDIEDAPDADVQAFYDEATGEGTVFVLNKSDRNRSFDIQLPTGRASITKVTELWHENPLISNSYYEPQNVMPSFMDDYNGEFNGSIALTAKPISLVKIDFTADEPIALEYEKKADEPATDEPASQEADEPASQQSESAEAQTTAEPETEAAKTSSGIGRTGKTLIAMGAALAIVAVTAVIVLGRAGKKKKKNGE